MRVIRAAAYWGIFFALGFVLGMVRVLWIAPALVLPMMEMPTQMLPISASVVDLLNLAALAHAVAPS